MGDLRQAQSMCQQARQLSAENSEVLDCGRAELLRARIMALAGDVKGALEHMQKARDIFAETSLLAGTKSSSTHMRWDRRCLNWGCCFPRQGRASEQWVPHASGKDLLCV